jgi:hypothetical protein
MAGHRLPDEHRPIVQAVAGGVMRELAIIGVVTVLFVAALVNAGFNQEAALALATGTLAMLVLAAGWWVWVAAAYRLTGEYGRHARTPRHRSMVTA